MNVLVPEDQIYRSLMNSLPLGIVRVDPEGKIVELNPAAEKITGCSAAQALGRPHGEILHALDAGVCPLPRNESAFDVEITLKAENSPDKILLLSSFPLNDSDGNRIGGIEIFREVTEAKRSQRERAEQLSQLAHDLKTPVVVIGGFLSRIEQGKAGPVTDEQRKDLRLLIEELANMEPMIDSFSDYARSILGRKKIRK